MLAMILYPEVQRKAQEELDHVIGTDRLPHIEECVRTISFSATILTHFPNSKENLPYIESIYKEVLRW